MHPLNTLDDNDEEGSDYMLEEASDDQIEEATGATKNTNDAQLAKREVTFTAYGENIEATVKLLSCNRNISVIDKEDIRYKRMFITSSSSAAQNKAEFGYGVIDVTDRLS